MRKCSHYVPLEEKCPRCVAEGLAREAARQDAFDLSQRVARTSHVDEVSKLDSPLAAHSAT